MKTTSSMMLSAALGALLTAAFVAASVGEIRAAEGGKGRSKGDRDKSGISPFVTIPPCAVSDGGGLRWSAGRSPFRGAPGTGTYGDIFFGGGASSLPASTANSTRAGDTGSGSSGGGGVVMPTPGNGSSAGGGSNVSVPGAAVIPVAAAAAANGPIAAAADGTVTAAAGVSSPAAVGTGGGSAPIALATPAAVTPEPASLLLIGTGLTALAFLRRSKSESKG
jgi:hypothetical protein